MAARTVTRIRLRLSILAGAALPGPPCRGRLAVVVDRAYAFDGLRAYRRSDGSIRRRLPRYGGSMIEKSGVFAFRSERRRRKP